MQYIANTDRRYRDKCTIRQRLEKADEWSRKPMTARAECAVAAIVGSVTFLLFVIVSGIA
jgi:hypothetical protein